MGLKARMNGFRAGFRSMSGRPKSQKPRLRAVTHFGVQARLLSRGASLKRKRGLKNETIDE
jgi:hypothetical protein